MAMPDDSNVFETTAWERDIGAARGTRVGAAAGARELGCTLYELDPGGQASPYHMHHANEELLLVLDGVLELRTPEGTREIIRGAVVVFPAGAGGAHRLRNVSDAPARYVMVSTMRFPEVAEQLDTGTVLVLKGRRTGGRFRWGAPAITSRSRPRLWKPTRQPDRTADPRPPTADRRPPTADRRPQQPATASVAEL
jgi:uncharacterized cupin superfamily protein